MSLAQYTYPVPPRMAPFSTIPGGFAHFLPARTEAIEQSEHTTVNQISDKAQSSLGVVRGTHVMTARGEVLVERLKIGDRIITRDRSMQPVRWIGSETVSVTKQNAPVLFRKGALKNSRDLIVSADHRVVVKGAEAMMLYGVKEVLVPARNLVNNETILRSVSGEVEFFQIVTDQHEVIYCEAAASESFMPELA